MHLSSLRLSIAVQHYYAGPCAVPVTAMRLRPLSRLRPTCPAVAHFLPPLVPLVPQEARLRDIMDDLHQAFKERVRGSRGERLAAGRDDELFSGEPLCQLQRDPWRRSQDWEAAGAAYGPPACRHVAWGVRRLSCCCRAGLDGAAGTQAWPGGWAGRHAERHAGQSWGRRVVAARTMCQHMPVNRRSTTHS